MRNVLIVDTDLNRGNHALVHAVKTATAIRYLAKVAVADISTIQHQLRHGDYLLIFAGGVPEHMASWLTTVCEIGKVPVFILIDEADQNVARWLDQSPVTIFARDAKGIAKVQPLYDLAEKLKAILD